MKKASFIFLILTLALSGCRDPINPYDPENPDYVQPDDDGTGPVYSSSMAIEIDGTAMGSGSDYSFGSAEADGGGGASAGPVNLVIRNNGNSSLSVSSAQLSGTDASDFSITQPPGSLVSPDEYTTCSLIFDPLSEGSKTAVLTIRSSDAELPVYTLNCTGTGVSQGSMKTLNSFLFAAADNADLDTDITGVIDEEEGTVSLILPVDVDLDNLVASFTCSAESIEIGTTVQESGVTQNDFSLPVTYTLTAEDSTTKDYTVTTGYDIRIACFGGTETDYAQSIGLDAEPDPYITGSFQGTIDFDPTSGGGEVASNGDFDVFVLKLQSDLDELRWAKSVGGTGWDRGNALAVAPAGHVYITGHFENTVDFDPAASGTAEETSNGDRDVFLFCLDAIGEFSWSLSYGGSSVYADIGVDLVENSSGNYVVAGQVVASVDFDPSAGTDIPDYYSEYDIAFSSYSNGSGSYGNTIRGAGDAVELIYGFTLDDFDNNYHTGRFDADCDMDPTAAGTDTRTCNGGTDAYIARWNADETYGWCRTFGGTLADAGSTICRYNNNVYIAGHFYGSDVDFNQDGSPADLHSSNGNSDVFFTKLSLDNDYVFTKTWGGSGDDNARCICALADGRIILGGNFYGTVDFDPSSGVDSHSSNGFGDIFITCFDGSTQEHMWTRTFGGSGSDSVSDLVYDADSGYLFLTGFFNDSVDFDPAAREQNFTSNGSADIFVMRIDL